MRTIVRNAEQFDQHGVSQSSGFDFCLLATENSGVNSRSMSIAVDSTSVAAFIVAGCENTRLLGRGIA